MQSLEKYGKRHFLAAEPEGGFAVPAGFMMCRLSDRTVSGTVRGYPPFVAAV